MVTRECAQKGLFVRLVVPQFFCARDRLAFAGNSVAVGLVMKKPSLDLVFARLKVMDNTMGSSETESGVNRLLARRSVRLAIIWVGWTLVGLFFTSQILVSYAYMEKLHPV